MVKDIDLAWLAGIIDGEGCFTLKTPVFRGEKNGYSPYTVWLVLCNTSEDMLIDTNNILKDLGVQIKPIRKVWKGKKATRWQYWIDVVRKHDLLKTTNALLPFLRSKRDEASIVSWFLTRSCQEKVYKRTELDIEVLKTLPALKANAGKTPPDLLQFLSDKVPAIKNRYAPLQEA